MKKGTKKFTGSLAAIATLTSVIAPTAAVFAAETTAEEMVTWAEQTKNFYDFNMALHKVMAMPVKNTEYYGLLARLQNISSVAKTPDVEAVLSAIDEFGTNADLTNFYNVYDLVNQVKDEKNRLYLQHELDSWGHDSVFTPAVVAATDAIIRAWNTKDASDVDAALDVIANVKGSGNISWLLGQVNNVRQTVSMSVQSVTAINANEIQVKFTRKVDAATAKNKANYVVTKNDRKYGSVYDNPTVYTQPASDIISDINVNGNVVTLKLSRNFNNGDKYSVDVKDAVLSSDLSTKVARYAQPSQYIFTDTTAPKLVGTRLDGKYLVLEFNEPITKSDANGGTTEAGFQVTVDGNEVQFGEPSTGVLTYEIKSANPLTSDKLAVGVHDVVVYNVRDLVDNNGNDGNKAAQLSTTYEIKKGTAPYVTSAAQATFNSVELSFNEPVYGAKVVIKKGNTVFFDGTVNAPDGTAVVELPPYAVAGLLWVTPSWPDKTYLYDSGATKAQVSVSVVGYVDEDSLTGSEYSSSVVLQRDGNTPTIISTYNNKIAENALKVVYDRTNLYGSVSASKLVVTDKNGVVRTVSASVSGDTLSIRVLDKDSNALDTASLNRLAPFTVSVAASTVKVDTDFFPAWYGVDPSTLVNPAETTTVLPNDSYEYSAKEAVDTVTISDNKFNVIYVTYKEAMSASAAKLANYTLDGTVLPTGTTLTMSGDNKKVTITLPKETYAKDVAKKLVVSRNVTTATGAFVVGDIATKEEYRSQLLQIHDNVSPTLAKAEYIVLDTDKPSPTKFVKVTFSENLSSTAWDNDDFQVVVNGSVKVIDNVIDLRAGDNTVTIQLKDAVNPGQVATVKVLSTSDIDDFDGNTATAGSTAKTSGNIQAVASVNVPALWNESDEF